MDDRRQEFLSFAYVSGALKFGEFVLNSGRVSPYFLNTGGFSNGFNLETLSRFYAAEINQNLEKEFMLYGPAYKGIPLAAATAVALQHDYSRSVPFAYDRKEAKDHGELGRVVGAPLIGDVVIVEDVITSGLSIDKSVDIIRAEGACPKAVVISLDRMERSIDSDQSAVQLVQDKYDIEILPLASFADLLEFVDNVIELHDYIFRLHEYSEQYVVHHT